MKVTISSIVCAGKALTPTLQQPTALTRWLRWAQCAFVASGLVGLTLAAVQQPATEIRVKSVEHLEGQIVRQTVLFPGWDPYEPVPAYVYFKQEAEKLPVVIFIHGIGGNKSYLASWHKELAELGLAVISVDAYLSGDRKIATPVRDIQAEQEWVWPKETVVNHTANDVSRILDVLPDRSEFDPTRVAVTGISMGGAITIVVAWREPRISVVMPVIGPVDFWWDVTQVEPGPQQDARIAEFSPRLKQLVASLDSNTPERMDAIAAKALFLVNGTFDHSIDIRSVRKFADEMRPRYEEFPGRFKFFEDENVGHAFSKTMKDKATQWLVRHLIEKPIRVTPDRAN